jgi:hypothetical protein
MYTVHDTGQGMFKIVDARRGTQAGVLTPRGSVVTPPVVNGDMVSFVVQLSDGTKMGTTHKLPTGQLVNQFRV